MKTHKWILLVEDDAPLAELTTLGLAPEKLACTVLLARDGSEALDCLYRRGGFQARTNGNPAFVLLDLKMPKVDGLEVLRQIKSDDQLKTIPVVMFTSSPDTSDVSRSYELGANAYVVKPADFGRFNRALERIGVFWSKINETPPDPEPADNAEFDEPPRMAAAG